MRPRFRLTRSSDIKRVRQLGKSYVHPLVVLVVIPNEQQRSRFGIVAGRSIGGAVQRNRSKRLLRAALHPFLPMIASGWDMLFLARQGMKAANYKGTEKALNALLKRAGLLFADVNVNQF